MAARWNPPDFPRPIGNVDHESRWQPGQADFSGKFLEIVGPSSRDWLLAN